MKQHSQGFLKLVAEAKNRINEISPQILKSKIDNNEKLIIIDVRETDEWETGKIPNAIHLSKGIIERDIEKIITDNQSNIVVYCSGGYRCALVADSLQKMGYTNVFSLDTGLQGWLDAGYSLVK
ncbi:TPA: sulfurtransferase [Legionella pneumophila]|uniref:rhodanese-like domain-containing protein n=1 Tax=Legionella pneumophila TaxID=446 RepID=UPI0004847DD1|nr:rhodanese-like domain-containing protein [Legionella pneumophila]MDW8877931.1 rhodanese-like domain-containing protein [Legionella pneumophila subsp. fraseri]MDW8900160.1 rhodanese-like domain-containing protein [Legionella pneumophila]MDW8905506.1 rhodanese-like domain-containing protein [Legionella pneumophila]MDW8960970.1 rhodanese-like domain-containing protein [Legionella pneumophila subsp. fraseri]MDW9035006.1 rhodanese-like domain-containing protein [Legionella pneumophila subsp. fra